MTDDDDDDGRGIAHRIPDPSSGNDAAADAPPPTPPTGAIDETGRAAKLRMRGNEAFARGDCALAHGLYGEALDACEDGSGEDGARLRAVIYCNRSRALAVMGEREGALMDAKRAAEEAPKWSKPRRRLAEACLSLGSYALAVAHARRGEELLLKEENNHSKSFRDLLDEIAIVAAENGSVAGFDGKLIYVRSAGEDAWLGREAPLSAVFDELEEEQPDPMFASGKAIRARGAPVHARTLHEAMEKADDGDRILLLRGTHNGCGYVVDVEKRVLIRGEGALRDATIDCRNNSPLFRIKRPCVIQNLDVDFTGFCEATRVVGDARVKPLIENCLIRSSGGDGVAIGGKSAPTFRNCKIMGNKSAIRAYGRSNPTFVDCNVTLATLQGVLAMKESRVIMHACMVQANEEDGVVAMEQANVVMNKCIIQDNKGPGVDVSDKAKVIMNDCEIDANVGGLWLWDEANAHAVACNIKGGTSHAVLIDVDARAVCRKCDIVGVVHASETGTKVAIGKGTVVTPLDVPTSLPRELKGAFKFDPCQFTRKQ